MPSNKKDIEEIEQSLKHSKIALFAILAFIALLTYLVISISNQVSTQQASSASDAFFSFNRGGGIFPPDKPTPSPVTDEPPRTIDPGNPGIIQPGDEIGFPPRNEEIPGEPGPGPIDSGVITEKACGERCDMRNPSKNNGCVEGTTCEAFWGNIFHCVSDGTPEGDNSCGLAGVGEVCKVTSDCRRGLACVPHPNPFGAASGLKLCAPEQP